jgi:hypothetical protein
MQMLPIRLDSGSLLIHETKNHPSISRGLVEVVAIMGFRAPVLVPIRGAVIVDHRRLLR